MSTPAPRTGWESFTDHGAIGFIVILAIILGVVFPPLILAYVAGFVVWALGKLHNRSDRTPTR